jgi:hypothetical protein
VISGGAPNFQGLFFRKWNLSLDLQAGYGNTHGYATIAVSHHFSWDEP